jgi:hypothetical protein
VAKKGGKDAVIDAVTDGTYNQLSTPLNCPKAEEDPQAQLENKVIPGAAGESLDDPMGYLEDLTGNRGRRGDPV